MCSVVLDGHRAILLGTQSTALFFSEFRSHAVIVPQRPDEEKIVELGKPNQRRRDGSHEYRNLGRDRVVARIGGIW
jgi:hypothetical protein